MRAMLRIGSWAPLLIALGSCAALSISPDRPQPLSPAEFNIQNVTLPRPPLWPPQLTQRIEAQYDGDYIDINYHTNIPLAPGPGRHYKPIVRHEYLNLFVEFNQWVRRARDLPPGSMVRQRGHETMKYSMPASPGVRETSVYLQSPVHREVPGVPREAVIGAGSAIASFLRRYDEAHRDDLIQHGHAAISTDRHGHLGTFEWYVIDPITET